MNIINKQNIYEYKKFYITKSKDLILFTDNKNFTDSNFYIYDDNLKEFVMSQNIFYDLKFYNIPKSFYTSSEFFTFSSKFKKTMY